MSESDPRTPPDIVAASDDPSYALMVFVAQELEHWGFEVDNAPLFTDADYALTLTIGGREYYLEVTPQ